MVRASAIRLLRTHQARSSYYTSFLRDASSFLPSFLPRSRSLARSLLRQGFFLNDASRLGQVPMNKRAR